MRCRYCGESMAFHLELVKEGRLYECWKCTCGAYDLRSKEEKALPVQMDKLSGALVVRLRCRNVYIFDREIFNDFTRRISRELVEEPAHVLLDLSEVGYVPQADLVSLVRLRRLLHRMGRELRIVHTSELFRSELRGIDAEADGYLYTSEAEACREPFPGEAREEGEPG